MTSRIWNILGLVLLVSPLALRGALPAAAEGKPAADGKPGAYPEMASIEQYLMADRKAEIALARSAAPPSISADASVMVLTRRGYEVAEAGKNGFVCLVDRSWHSAFGDPQFWNPKIRSPLCLNPAAVRSVLPMEHRQTELALARVPQTEMITRMKRAVDKHEFGAPEPGAMSYMMSRDQYLNDDAAHWHPHVMFYFPGTVEGVAMGANLPRSPLIGGPQPLPGGGRMPVTVYIVPVGQWSDGTAVDSHDHG